MFQSVRILLCSSQYLYLKFLNYCYIEAREQYSATDMEEQSNFSFLISTSVGAATVCLTVFAIVIALCWWIQRYYVREREREGGGGKEYSYVGTQSIGYNALSSYY